MKKILIISGFDHVSFRPIAVTQPLEKDDRELVYVGMTEDGKEIYECIRERLDKKTKM